MQRLSQETHADQVTTACESATPEHTISEKKEAKNPATHGADCD
jgi:hypothetical protein